VLSTVVLVESVVESVDVLLLSPLQAINITGNTNRISFDLTYFFITVV
jgi:hypothetical protein